MEILVKRIAFDKVSQVSLWTNWMFFPYNKIKFKILKK